MFALSLPSFSLVALFAAGGKPSTRLPPGELVEQQGSLEMTESTQDNTKQTPRKHEKIHKASIQVITLEKCKHSIEIRNVTCCRSWT